MASKKFDFVKILEVANQVANEKKSKKTNSKIRPNKTKENKISLLKM